MKKVITILITFLLLVSCVAPACADDADAALKAKVESLLADGFPGRYRIEEHGRFYCIETWADGLADDVAAARRGVESAVKSWESMRSQVAGASATVQAFFDSNASTARSVLFVLVDETNHDTVYLAVADGEVLFDCVGRSATPAAAPQEGGYTMSQKNAIGTAESYLSWSNFSRSGLIGQLEYEGYSHEDAEFAVDHITVDWFEQAVGSARSYLSWTSFSRSGLIGQLEYEGFTHEQAEYAASQVGY